MAIFTGDVKTIKIIWDTNPRRPYRPGEQISGKVVLNTEKESVKIQKATVTIIGVLSNLWIEVSVIKPCTVILIYIY